MVSEYLGDRLTLLSKSSPLWQRDGVRMRLLIVRAAGKC
jgi:hypothetical protein